MKTPWKFLAQLASRGRPTETRENSVGDDADTEANESGARHASALSSDATEVSGRPDHIENPAVDTTSDEPDSDLDVTPAISPPSDGEEVQRPIRHEISQPDADAHALVPESKPSKKSPRTPRAKRPERSKRTRAGMVSGNAAIANSNQSAQSSSSREGFFDEVASLDEEIRQLRSQLAQKLHLQNLQLAQMLERFDGS
ncbi:hypothetical protein SAMN02927900_01870 [Rhizobium mongolense subsp. loessense]|uniref:Uncharacterized protein n=1 Tax=Rhizobium mongolense subsp. loessense TaxID=158890 RepID=A0A1G4QU54_9HYPH|nr:hypothetical protein [Rhizobium mongolense]SCW48183.1 hypothetical protein SAMN02927900_01870 [Rhizobium mongolense subsp. loessense]